MKIAITGGGTGGHLSIARALCEAAFKKGVKCLYIGSCSGQDRAWFENEAKFEQKHFLQSGGVVDKKGFARVKALLNILNLSFKARQILRDNEITAVFSVGGYSAAAASFAAILSHTPLFIHEQNSKSGSLNTLLKPFAKGFYSAFTPPFAPYPVAAKFFDTARLRKELKTIIFLGGSQGASFINDLALSMAVELKNRGVEIIHQSGEKDFEKCTKFYAQNGVKADIFAFSKVLHEKMARADLAISRAGASTLFELAANALPAVFIPYPYAAKNHQYFNAKFLFDKNLCQIFTQNELKISTSKTQNSFLNNKNLSLNSQNLLLNDENSTSNSQNSLLNSENSALNSPNLSINFDTQKLINAIFATNLELISSDLKSVISPNGAEILLESALGKINKNLARAS